jgi:hypothetical protein
VSLRWVEDAENDLRDAKVKRLRNMGSIRDPGFSTITACLKALSWHFPVRTEEHREETQAEITIEYLSNRCVAALQTHYARV